MPVIGMDHVQLAMPAAHEDAARRFYGDILGLIELPKPADLAAGAAYGFCVARCNCTWGWKRNSGRRAKRIPD